MPAEPQTTRVSMLMGLPVPAGGRPGRVVDVVAECDDEGRLRLTAVLVARGPWGRLLGYERDELRGPWLIEKAARWILRRRLTQVPWPEVRPHVR